VIEARRPAGLIVIVTVLVCAYVALFVPPNLTGAKDLNMVGAFNLDELVMYPAITHMLDGRRSVLDVVAHFAVPGFWTYGYPFFAASATSVLPVRLLVDPAHTLPYMLVLRELSPLFLAIAIALLCYLQLGRESLLGALLLFVFLALLPAVVNLSMWWHPDALAILFVVLTIFALDRDSLRFGRWYYAAAVFCGLATGTKLIGVWFVATIAVYLGLGLRSGGLRRTTLYASQFVGIMLATIVVSNPLMLWPKYARLMIAGTSSGIEHIYTGLRTPTGFSAWSQTMNDGFGGWWIAALALAAGVLGIIAGARRRLLNTIILTWTLPLSIWLIFFAGYKAERLILPALLPLFSCLGGLRRRSIPFAVAALSMIIAAGFYVRADARNYQEMTNRERNSANLQFYRQLEAAYLSARSDVPQVRIFRDPYVYFPPSAALDVHFVWRSAVYRDISALDPDLIVLERDYIEMFSMPGPAVDSVEARNSQPLYQDAKHDHIAGYRKILENSFAVAFERIARD
jgi:hypothetical protein